MQSLFNTTDNPFSNPLAGEDKKDSFEQMLEFGSSIPGLPSMQRDGEPTPEEMEKAAEAVRFSKVVKVQDIHVETYDFSKKKDVEAYRKKYVELYQKASLSQVLITVNERQFINDINNPRWVLHLEWIEYALQKKDHMVDQEAGDTDDTDSEDS
jgi:hypothetical protein